jgi:hypothetical protein
LITMASDLYKWSRAGILLSKIGAVYCATTLK